MTKTYNPGGLTNWEVAQAERKMDRWISRYTPEAHKSNDPNEVHWFVRDRTDDSRVGWFMHVENAQAAATKMNKDAAR